MHGLHILAEFHACPPAAALEDVAALAALCLDACREAGLSPVAQAFHQFPGAGATGAVVLAESHLAIHTWPELAAVTFDLYVCNFSRDNRAAAESVYSRLYRAFLPGHAARREITRGESIGDHPAGAGMR